MNLAAVRRRIEIGDLLLLFYALTFIREYAWTVPNNLAAWAISVIVTLALWVAYLKFKPDGDNGVPRAFWIADQTRGGVIGMSRCLIPNGESASSTA